MLRFFGLWLSLCLCIPLSAGEHGIVMSADSPWTDTHGYTPVIITVQSPADTTMYLQIEAQGATASMSLPLRAGEKILQTLLLPPAAEDRLYVSQVMWETTDGASGQTNISRYHSDRRGFVLDPDETFDLVGLNKKITQKSGSSDAFRRINAEQMPNRWQGYPSWITLILTPKGQAELSESQIQALVTWVRTGGSLCVTTAAQTQQWLQHHVHVPFIDVASKRHNVLQSLFNSHENHKSWSPEDVPVPGTETVPVKTFVLFAIGFALVVGPLNLWWVRRRNARHLFLFTTPLLSLATCIILIVASLIADGVSTKRSSVQLVLIDHATQQSLRWTGCSYFAAFSTTTLDLDHQAKFAVLDHVAYDRYSYRGRRPDPQPMAINWGNVQRLNGSVIPARMHRQLGFIEALPERRRIEVRKQADGWQITNGLGVAIGAFSWLDGDGGKWSCAGVLAGEQQSLAQLERSHGQGSNVKAVSHDKNLPEVLNNRLSPSASRAWQAIHAQPFSFIATIAQPLDPLPGPEAIDVVDPTIFVAGLVPPTGGTP